MDKRKYSSNISKLFIELSDNQTDSIAIGIDAPRMPIKNYEAETSTSKQIVGQKTVIQKSEESVR